MAPTVPKPGHGDERSSGNRPGHWYKRVNPHRVSFILRIEKTLFPTIPKFFQSLLLTQVHAFVAGSHSFHK